jgi:molybdenum cofactor cytidylyltransferase
MGLTLGQALRLVPVRGGKQAAPGTTAIVGSGGKSTAMFQLARELTPPVIVTASTHLGRAQADLADRHHTVTDLGELDDLPFRGITLVTGPMGSDDRWEPAGENVLAWLNAHAAGAGLSLLIEADGSRQKSLKAPAEHEPPIPEFATLVIVVAGMSAIGQPMTAETLHRPDTFSMLTGLSVGAAVTSAAVATVLTHPQGGLKNIPSSARRVALLNQADTDALRATARTMVPALLSAYESVIIASMQEPTIHAVHGSAAGVVLAAGESKRFGRTKQLLDWHGQPFVRTVATTAISAGLAPVVVVTGAGADDVGAAVKDLPVLITRNEGWATGQASSIKAGVASLPGTTSAALFLLADQPQVPVAAIRGLLELHATTLSPIIAPLVLENKRGNPVLFDRVTFSDLLCLQGDEGGRAIFDRYPVEYLPWHDESLLSDVDTEEDYRRLMEQYGQ